jgi:hypothetical protein
MGDGQDAEELHVDPRPLRIEAAVVRPLRLGRKLEPLLQLGRPWDEDAGDLRVAKLVDEDPGRGQEAEDPDAQELRGRPRAPDECHRHAGDGRDERRQTEAHVDEGPQELRRLLVVEPKAVVCVHGRR